MIAVYTILHGTAWGLRGSLMHAIPADYFGRNAIGMILGFPRRSSPSAKSAAR